MDNDFDLEYADELELLNELENSFNSKENQQSTKKVVDVVFKKSITIGTSNNEEMPFTEIETNIYQKKARIDYETDKLKDISLDDDDLNELETEKRPISNSSITITKINANDNYFKRKQINFDHLKKSKDLNITLSNGKKSTIRIFDSEDTYESITTTAKTSSLLEKPIDVLKYEISSDIIKKCKLNIDERKNADMDVVEFNNELLMKNKDETNHHLWVEKYSPKSFIDLLSDDGINRLLLTWLKSWDHVVFGKELPMSDKKQKAEANKLAASKKRKRIFNQNEIELEEQLSELDEYRRPKIKVALLAGAPGLGKTTLAHIVADRAGYNVIEMNASDDRSVDAFKQHIESVTQIKGNVSDKNFKPNLLVIDEIDGAALNSVQVLVNEINENSKKTKSKEGPTLLRPIICICNDLYAPSLKQLRQTAIVFQCPPIATHRLAERLYSICEQNGLSADIDALIALSDKSSNDIRSCLNTLQFLSKTTTRINAQIINQLNVGQKDYEKGIFTILGEIFYLINYKKSASKCDAASAILNKFSYMVNLCNNCDLDRIMQALHENYLSIRTRDGNFDSIKTASDWFMFCDVLNKHVKEKQEYTYLSYQRYLPVIFNLLFSTTAQQTKKLQYPHSFFDYLTKLAKNDNILKHFLTDMSPLARSSYNSSRKAILDLLPFLIDIMQPNLRAVSTQLFSKNEKEKLDSLIRTMILFNINYRQERCVDGQYSYVFEPAFDEIIKFSGLKQRKQLCYMIKQQIAREITVERLKMADKYKNSTSTTQQNDKNSTANGGNNKAPGNFFSSPVGLKAASIMSKLKNPSAKKDILDPERKVDKQQQQQPTKELAKDGNDMFARYFKKTPKEIPVKIDTNKSETSMETTKNTSPKGLTKSTSSSLLQQYKFSNDVWLKYKEGFVNAVRYNIKINKLL